LRPNLSAQLLTPVLLCALVYLVWRAGRRVGGPPGAALGVLALTWQFSLWDALAFAMPRGCAPVVAAAFLCAFVEGNVLAAGAIVVVGAGIYPHVAYPLGVALAIALVGPFPAMRGRALAWSLRRRLALLAGVATAAGLMLLPVALRVAEWGPVASLSELPVLPEFGPAGRWGAELGGTDTTPSFPTMLHGMGRRIYELGAARSLLPGVPTQPAFRLGLLALLLGLALAALARREHLEARARLGAVALALPITYLALCAAAPYLYWPGRVLGATLPPLVCVTIAALASERSERGPKRWRALTLSVALGACLLLSARVAVGPSVNVDGAPAAPLYEAIAALPRTAVVAGWPDDLLDGVPLFSRRSIYVGYETYWGFLHRRYRDLLRARTARVLDAFVGADPASVAALRADGVTHVVLDDRFLSDAGRRSFLPFMKPELDARWAALVGQPPAIARAAPGLAIFRRPPYWLLDLSRSGR
jgi:hypothetical protein